MMVARYGLERHGDPRWFHGLDPLAQTDALALILPPLRTDKPRRATHNGQKLHRQVDPDAQLGWLLDGAL